MDLGAVKARVESDPSKYIAKMLGKLDDEDKEAFNLMARMVQPEVAEIITVTRLYHGYQADTGQYQHDGGGMCRVCKALKAYDESLVKRGLR